MKITLYNNTSDNRVVNKNITKLWDYDAAIMRDSFNVRGDSVLLKAGQIQLYDYKTVDNNKIISPTTGELNNNSLFVTSDFIYVNGYVTISYDVLDDRTASNYVGYYGSDKEHFERRGSFPAKDGIRTFNYTGWIKISIHKNYCDYTKVMVNMGNKAEPFQPYADIDLNFANYCYIDELQRYYYIKEVTAERNDLWRLDLKCDVLMTFASGIRSLSGTVDRQQNKYNGYIPDGEYKQLAYSQITAKAFPNAMNSDTLILMTVG